MDKISKFLQKLSQKELWILLNIFEKIIQLDLEELDVKKLQWEEGLYRVRKGKIRIIFKKTKEEAKIIDVNYRNINL